MGRFTRLTISGYFSDDYARDTLATHSHAPRPERVTSTQAVEPGRAKPFGGDSDNIATAGSIATRGSSVFELGIDASLVLENMSMVSGSCGPIFNLRPSSRVYAYESSFQVRTACGENSHSSGDSREDRGDASDGGGHVGGGGDVGGGQMKGGSGDGAQEGGGGGGGGGGRGWAGGDGGRGGQGGSGGGDAAAVDVAGDVLLHLVHMEGRGCTMSTATSAAVVGAPGGLRLKGVREGGAIVGERREIRSAGSTALEDVRIVRGASSSSSSSSDLTFFTVADGTPAGAAGVDGHFVRSKGKGEASPHGNDELLAKSRNTPGLPKRGSRGVRQGGSHGVPEGRSRGSPQGWGRGVPIGKGGSRGVRVRDEGPGGVPIREEVEGEFYFLPTSEIWDSSSEAGALLVVRDSVILVPSAAAIITAGDEHRRDTRKILDKTHPPSTNNDASVELRRGSPQFFDETHLPVSNDALSDEENRSYAPQFLDELHMLMEEMLEDSSKAAGNGGAIAPTQEEPQPSGLGSPSSTPSSTLWAGLWRGSVFSWMRGVWMPGGWRGRDRRAGGAGGDRPVYSGRRLRGGVYSGRRLRGGARSAVGEGTGTVGKGSITVREQTSTVEDTPIAVVDGGDASPGAEWSLGTTAMEDTARHVTGRPGRAGVEEEEGGGGQGGTPEVDSRLGAEGGGRGDNVGIWPGLESESAEFRRELEDCPEGYEGIGEYECFQCL